MRADSDCCQRKAFLSLWGLSFEGAELSIQTPAQQPHQSHSWGRRARPSEVFWKKSWESYLEDFLNLYICPLFISKTNEFE